MPYLCQYARMFHKYNYLLKIPSKTSAKLLHNSEARLGILDKKTKCVIFTDFKYLSNRIKLNRVHLDINYAWIKSTRLPSEVATYYF